MESFFSDLLQVIISYWTQYDLESFQTSTMKLIYENSQQPKDVYRLSKKAPQLFDCIGEVL